MLPNVLIYKRFVFLSGESEEDKMRKVSVAIFLNIFLLGYSFPTGKCCFIWIRLEGSIDFCYYCIMSLQSLYAYGTDSVAFIT